MPTNIDYAALRELCEAATPGPWADSGWEQSDYDDDYNVTRTRTWQSIKTLDPAHQGKGEQARFGDPNGGICNLEDGEYISNPLREHDGPFIAASRTALPAMYAMMIEHADAAIAAEDAYPAECAAAVSTEGTPESRRIAGRKFDQAAGAIRATRATTAALLKVLQPQNTAEGGRDV